MFHFHLETELQFKFLVCTCCDWHFNFVHVLKWRNFQKRYCVNLIIMEWRILNIYC